MRSQHGGGPIGSRRGQGLTCRRKADDRQSRERQEETPGHRRAEPRGVVRGQVHLRQAPKGQHHVDFEREVGPERAESYWTLFEQLRTELDYADYLGALQRYRSQYPHDLRLLTVSRFLINYPFANRLYPGALDALEEAKACGAVALLTDGDVVFQPRKVDRSGLFEMVDGNVLIYVHKEHELEDVEARFPADHYVLVDDKLRILTAVKKSWGARVTTVFVRQGHYALDPKLLAQYPPADVSLQRIGDFVEWLK